MSYYNYHWHVKQKIKEGKLESFKIVDEYNKIKPAMLLFFNDGKIHPIREHRWQEYLEIMKGIK